MEYSFKLFNKRDKHIANEYHEKDSKGFIVIYHESLVNQTGKRKVTARHYVKHTRKQLQTQQTII